MQHLGKNIVIASALLAAGFAIAWLRFRPYLENGTELTDGSQQVDLRGEDLRFALWDVPSAWPGGGERVDSTPARSPDGRYVVFAGGMPGERRDLFVAMVDGDRLTPPESLSALNTAFDELSPSFTAEGGLLFASNREAGRGGFDLYLADFRDGTATNLRPLPEGINTTADERDPAALPNGGFVYATNPKAGGRSDFDLYRADPDRENARRYRVTRLNSVCSLADDLEPDVSRDGRMLVFASSRIGDGKSFDLFRCLGDGESFREPQRIATLSTTESERSPRFSDEGFTLLFERHSADPKTTPSVLRARSVELFKVPGRPIGWMELLLVASLLLMALLAWLAKRWEALDVLYKCFLIAILVHLLMLWYSRRVPVEPEEVVVAKRQGLFKVQIASALERANASKERGGKLDVSRPTQTASAAPSRQAIETKDDAGPRADMQSLELARANPSQPSATPERGESAAKDRTRAPEKLESMSLADRGETFAKNEAKAQELAVGGPRTVNAARTNASEPSGPARGELANDAANGQPSAAAPQSLALDRGKRPEVASAVNSTPRDSASDFVQKQGANPESAVSLVDREAFEKVDAGAQASELAAPEPTLTAIPRASAPSSAPERGAFAADLAADIGTTNAPSAPPSLGELAVEPRADLGGPERRETSIDRPERAAIAEGVDVAIDLPSDAASPTAAAAPAPDLVLSEPVSIGASRSESASSDSLEPMRFDLPDARGADLPMPEPQRLTFDRAEPSIEMTTPSPESSFEHTPYKTRFGLEKELALKNNGGSEETERAVALGLRYLASQQGKDGAFGDTETYDDKYGYVAVGRSALAMLAFLGAGHTPTSNTEHSQVVVRVIRFLKEVQTENGHFGWTSAYSHGISTYALAECYALTKDESLRPTLELAVKHILDNQSKSRDPRNGGGWGYYNPDGAHYDKWSRVSVTAWQVMALESARLSGIAVPDTAFDRARNFLKNAYDEPEGYFRYNHDPERLNSEWPTLPASTPAALFVLSLLGEDVAAADYAVPRSYVLERAPKEYRWRGDEAFVKLAAGNVYFWYYGTLSLFRIGGEPWEQWNTTMKKTLLGAQNRDGSWKPLDNYAAKAGDDETSRCYTTAMCVLSLEVYYRYFTPLLKVK